MADTAEKKTESLKVKTMHVYKTARLMTFIYCLCVHSITNSAAPKPIEVFVSGGDLWYIEDALEQNPSVLDIETGYLANSPDREEPSYQQVLLGKGPYVFASRVLIKGSPGDLLSVSIDLMRALDTNDKFGFRCLRGEQFVAGVSFLSGPSLYLVNALNDEADRLGKEYVTIQSDLQATFWPAKDPNKSFRKKNPAKYQEMRLSCTKN